jgi:hypothetical protein
MMPADLNRPYLSSFLFSLYWKIVSKSFFVPINLGLKTCVFRKREKSVRSSFSGYPLYLIR